MSLLERLKLTFRPLRRDDGDFGPLLFMVADAPAKSYWEAEWRFPPTGECVSIGLHGNKDGPFPEFRQFYLSRVEAFDRIVQVARPHLDAVFREWLKRPLAVDLWTDLKLSGFSVEDPKSRPVAWEVSFETMGARWLCITIPFIGDDPQEAVIDT